MRYLAAGVTAVVLLSLSSASGETNGTTAGPTSGSTNDSNGSTVPSEKPVLVIETSAGVIKAELWPDKAPKTVENFLGYADAKFYDGLIFHRVISGFMVQGGGFTPDLQQKANRAPVKNEARTDTPNKRGTLAMARTAVIDSATSQFFINHKDNAFLDHKDNSQGGFGYCVFGKVIEGMDVVDKIATAKTTARGPFPSDVPETPIVIKSIRRGQ